MSTCQFQGFDIEVTVDGVVVRGRIACLSRRNITVHLLEPLQSPFAGYLHIPLLGAAPRENSFFAVTDVEGGTRPSKRGWEVAHSLLEEEYRAVREARADDALLARLLLETRDEVEQGAGTDRGLPAEEVRAERLRARRELRAGRLDKWDYDRHLRELRRQGDRHDSLERAVADLLAARYREQRPEVKNVWQVLRVWKALQAAAASAPPAEQTGDGVEATPEAANEGGDR